jgi:hypothetical protein
MYIRDTNDAQVEVEVLTLNTILALINAPPQFGLLMIDAEGGDLEVLQGIDFARYQPAVILTENFAPKYLATHRLLNQAGYDFRETIGADSIWTSQILVGENKWPEQSPPFVRQVDPAGFLLPVQNDSGLVCIDDMNATLTFIRGWAFLDTARPVPAQLAMVIGFTDGALACFQGFRCPRKDVAEHFASPDLLMSGFRIYLPEGLDRASVAYMRLMQNDGSMCHISSALPM